jgi:hypothetical protein
MLAWIFQQFDREQFEIRGEKKRRTHGLFWGIFAGEPTAKLLQAEIVLIQRGGSNTAESFGLLCLKPKTQIPKSPRNTVSGSD